jgi:hypothetical protein
MNKINKLLQTPTRRKQHAWMTPLSIASLALIATVSISAINIDVHAGEPVLDTKRNTPTDYTVITFVKITDALMAGTITPEEAAKKIHATNRVDTYLSNVEAEISEAVASGKMTVEEGMEKYDAAVKNINLRMNGGEKNGNARAESYLKKIGAEIREAIANGEMTEEEGKAKYAEAETKVQSRMGGEKGKTNERAQAYLTKIGTEIREAIASGTMTPREGKAKYAEAESRMQQRMGGEKGKNNERAQAYLTKIGTEIREAIASGTMTPEEGKEQYLAAVESIKKRMAKAAKGEQSDRGAKDRRGKRDRDPNGRRGSDKRGRRNN